MNNIQYNSQKPTYTNGNKELKMNRSDEKQRKLEAGRVPPARNDSMTGNQSTLIEKVEYSRKPSSMDKSSIYAENLRSFHLIEQSNSIKLENQMAHFKQTFGIPNPGNYCFM